MPFLNSLSGRFLVLTVIFVMLAEILIFVPSVARYREDYLLARLERAQIASLALLADDALDADLEKELLNNAGVFNVVLRRDEMRQLMLSSPIPAPVAATYDLRDPSVLALIGDALRSILEKEDTIIRVIGAPTQDAGLLIEVTMESQPLRRAMLDFGERILVLSAMISAVTAALLFLAVRRILVAPIRKVVRHMQSYADAPEDVRRIIEPNASLTELRAAEEALQSMQQHLTAALKQKDRLAQLGGAVAKVSHDLRNILTSAQLFADSMERSDDPRIQRIAPKLVGSISRAVNLCEATLAFGRAEEPPPSLTRVTVSGLVEDVLEGERLAAEGHLCDLRAEVPPGLMLRCDPEQMYRVIGNLVRNARQAIIATGAAGAVTVRAAETEEAWFLSVEDTGPGLPAKARDNLFTPFQGGARKGGAGLGLAIASELVRGHGGRLDLTRSDDRGTVFTIRLPKTEISENSGRP
ncbi:sensor histidine kinase [Mangrovicoccus algicola]|uniref:histidine kinase n=1 Tax=Mangrovicoccus algicola TaxID=2771008 RepID=A0A8J6YW00_9RHOB|nr:HAMP domain-containing sensor histidine kinase [Mangrovicoccus algicola]MBE3640233.1 HAMP domain-containing histidine kinase [Mangrovicoccus algicola]